MSLESKIQDALTRIGTEFKTVYALTGALTNLTTTNKTNLVAALNEIKALIPALINDSSTSSSSTTLSANKISALIAQAKSDIIGGASSAYDTLIEIQTLLQGDDASISSILTSVGNRVRFDASQTLSGGQQAQAIANIGAISASDVGDVTTNLVTVFEAALV